MASKNLVDIGSGNGLLLDWPTHWPNQLWLTICTVHRQSPRSNLAGVYDVYSWNEFKFADLRLQPCPVSNKFMQHNPSPLSLRQFEYLFRKNDKIRIRSTAGFAWYLIVHISKPTHQTRSILIKKYYIRSTLKSRGSTVLIWFLDRVPNWKRFKCVYTYHIYNILVNVWWYFLWFTQHIRI